MALNILGVELPSADDEICIICHDPLSSAQTYILPECKHQYHTQCVVTWFRHRGCYEWNTDLNKKNEIDGRCPHCGNAGINNVNLSEAYSGNSRRSHYMTMKDTMRFKTNKREGMKPGGPVAIRKDMDKLDLKQEAYTELRKTVMEFKKRIKDEPVKFAETKKQLRADRHKLWMMQRQIGMIKRRIASYPIVPLIIPLPIDIN